MKPQVMRAGACGAEHPGIDAAARQPLAVPSVIEAESRAPASSPSAPGSNPGLDVPGT